MCASTIQRSSGPIFRIEERHLPRIVGIERNDIEARLFEQLDAAAITEHGGDDLRVIAAIRPVHIDLHADLGGLQQVFRARR